METAGAAHGRPRPAAHRLAAVQEGGRLGAAAARDVGPRERPPRELAVRPRLALRALLGARRRAAGFPLWAIPKAWTDGHERRWCAARCCGSRSDSEADVEKLKGTDRRQGAVGGRAARAEGPRGRASSSATREKQLDELEQYQIPGPARPRAAPFDREAFLKRRRIQRALEKLYESGAAAGGGRALRAATRTCSGSAARGSRKAGDPKAGHAARRLRHAVEPRGAPARAQDRRRGRARREGHVPRAGHERLQRASPSCRARTRRRTSW